MKILWVGDAVVSTGFARCTHAVCDNLYSHGYDVIILGINYYGDPHPYPYPIYPCHAPFDGGSDAMGVNRLPRLIERLQPDLVIILQDPWNIPDYLKSIERYNKTRIGFDLPPIAVPPIIAWLAVDAKNQSGASALNALSHVMVWTKFAKEELAEGGYTGQTSITPLGVDTDLFYPRDKVESREVCIPSSIPSDAFIVGVVGRNQPRKRIDLCLQYFAEWVHTRSITNAYLMLHVAPTGEQGCEIRRLAAYYKISKYVILSVPDVGMGEDNAIMPYIYSTMDVHLNLSQGEGWGLCTHESMACGVANIGPDWSGLGSWTRGIDETKPAAMILIPCTSTALSAPFYHHPYTIGGVADKAETVAALDRLYRNQWIRDRYAQAGYALAREFTWQRTGDEFRREMERVMTGIAEKEESVYISDTIADIKAAVA